MDVRQVRPTDAPLVLALALDEGSHVVRCFQWPVANPVARTVAHSLLPLASSGRAWLAREGPTIGLLEARPRPYVIGWDLTRLAVRGNTEEVLAPLLQAATSYLQSRGVPRLFARCQEDQAENLQTLGFRCLAHEYLLAGPEGDVGEDVPLPVDSRYRMPQDAWPLHQLEREITPSMIGQIEGLTSRDWSRQPRDTAEIVVERDGKIVAWIGCARKPRHGFIPVSMLVHPDFKELGPVLLRHVLHRAPAGGKFLARVRSYQVETLNALQDADFQIMAREILLVKHAKVEFALEARVRRRVASVPTIQAFNTQLIPSGAGGPTASPPAKDEDDST